MRISLNDDREWANAVVETFFPLKNDGETNGQRDPNKPEANERGA